MDLKTDVEKTVADNLVETSKLTGMTPEQLKAELYKLVSTQYKRDSIYLSVSLSVGDVIRPDSHEDLHIDNMTIHLCPSSVYVVYAINDEHLDHIYPKPYVKDRQSHDDKVQGVYLLEYEDVSKHDGINTIDLLDYSAVHYYSRSVDIITLTLHCSYVGNIKYRLDSPAD